MKKLLIYLFLFLVFGASSKAQESLDTFKMANQLYENAQFNEAEQLYISLLAKDIISDDLHFNLANTYFKTKRIAPAILHYEKALKINPSNEDAAYNLKLANAKTVDKVEAIPELFFYRWWKSIYNLMSADNWAKLTCGFLLIAALLFIAYLFANTITIKKMGFYISVTALGLGLFTWFMAAQQKSYLESKSYAIIMQPTVNVISAPTSGSSQLFVLHEGTKVKIKDVSNEWLKVALPNGNEGWIESSKLESI